ncbi:MAG: alpha-amylase family glycosyl hydrolase [Bacteroidota bacterium]
MFISLRFLFSLLGLALLPLFAAGQTTYETVGIIGTATTKGWDESTPMVQNEEDEHQWTLEDFSLSAGELKFRANNNWDVNWGATAFPSGTGRQDGPNIPIPAGIYDIFFNDTNGEYRFESTSDSTIAIVTLSPEVPSLDEEVTIIYNAAQGVSGLVGAEKVYMHSGVILSGPDGITWENVVGNWGQDDGVGEMTAVADKPNQWQITLLSIREYYSVPSGTPAFKLGLVFRNADGTQTGKSNTDGDIFAAVNPGSYVRFNEPANDQSFVVAGGSLTIIAEASGTASSLEMQIDNGSGFQSVASLTDATKISYEYVVSATETIQVKVLATIEGEAVESNRELQLVVRAENTVAELPEGATQGINYSPNDQTQATLVLLAPQKEFVYLVGDFTNWQIDPAYQMNQTPDGEYFWFTVTGLTPQQAYVYQYWVDGTIKVGDPYADQVADPYNDGAIPESLYPNLPEYTRIEFGVATVLQTGQAAYEWQFPEVVGGRPANEELVVYELLLRDFLESHSYDDLTDTLSYLKRMGVNAIELMPIMEFEGNESWGYNPSYALAPDKYYGTDTDLKEFIDQAHAEGFVVILDMVLNHHFGQSPMVRMYWDEANNRPAENSPWFNSVAAHPFNVGYDFDHESTYTQAYVDDVNRYWIEEFEFDGFRFDLSKGFTQNTGKDPNDVGAWSSYDQSRIDLLNRMADQIWAIDPNTYIILEHLGANNEEKVLADYGMMLWGNMNHPYNDVINGKTETDLNWSLSSTRGWTNKNLMVYMESHDEERLMVRALNEGLSSGDYDIKDLSTAMERIKLASTFFYTLPGPKMFWQFGELGYDFSIDYNGRVGNKPIPWGNSDDLNYYSDEGRKRLYEAKAAIINLVNDYNEVFEGGEFSWTSSGQLRQINISHEAMNVTIVGNFGVTRGTMTPSFQRTGTWYDFFSGSEYEVVSGDQVLSLAPGEFRIFLDQSVGFPPPGLVDWTSIVTGFNGTNNKFPPPVLYPNPVSDWPTIDRDTPLTDITQVKITDIRGVVYDSWAFSTGNLNSDWRTDVSGMKPGIYFLELASQERRQTFRFAVQ